MKQLGNRDNKINDLNKELYINRINNIITKKIENIYSSNDSFISNIDQFNVKDKIHNLVDIISKKEEYKIKCFDKIDHFISNKSNTANLVKHLNIVLVGKTGVGKTTLINAVLEYTEDECLKTVFGKPYTGVNNQGEEPEPKYHESKHVPLFRIANSRGIELKNYEIDKLSGEINEFIKKKLESGDPDQFVHCIWYCITGTRLEDIEMDTLKELSKIYQSKSIPIIMVYTRAISKTEIKKMEKYIIDNYNYGYDFIPVLAEKLVIDDEYVKKPFGIPELKEKSVIRAKEAVKISCYENYVNQTKREIKEQGENIKKELKSFISNTANKKIKNMEEGKNNEEICDDLKNLLLNLISHSIYKGTRRYISIESESLIDKFIKSIISDKFSQSFNKRYKKYIKETKNQLFEDREIKDYNDIDGNEKQKIITDLMSKKCLVNDLLYKRAWISYVKTYIKKICDDCALELGDNAISIYHEILNQKDFKDWVTGIVQKEFDKIKENLNL
jgi:flagellar biosynthesis GTPase FlhF